MNFIDFGEELVWITRLYGQFAYKIRYSLIMSTSLYIIVAYTYFIILYYVKPIPIPPYLIYRII